jgi:hypothetical protein
MTEDATRLGHRPHSGARLCKPPLHQGGACSALWHPCLGKFKLEPINKYDDFSNPEEFIQVYHTVIEATGGDDRIKVNYLPTTLFGVARSWLVNLLEDTIYNWD